LLRGDRATVSLTRNLEGLSAVGRRNESLVAHTVAWPCRTIGYVEENGEGKS
jgi:hypothetical protein